MSEKKSTKEIINAQDSIIKHPMYFGMAIITIFTILSASIMFIRQSVHEYSHIGNFESHGKKAIFRSRTELRHLQLSQNIENKNKNNNRKDTESDRITAASTVSTTTTTTVDNMDSWIDRTLTNIKQKRNKYQQTLYHDIQHYLQMETFLHSHFVHSSTLKTHSNIIPFTNQVSSSSSSRLHAVTYASHGGRDDRFCRAIESAIRHDVDITILGWNIPWKGLSQKLQAAYDYSKSLKKDDIVLFTDAFDVLYVQSSESIEKKFLQQNSSIVFSAECGCWPHIAEDPNICLSKYPTSPTPYRYLNSGTWIGYAKPASEMLRVVINEAGKNFDNANDQKLIADLYIAGRFDIHLDYYTTIFQAMHMTLDPPLAYCDPSADIQLVYDQNRKLSYLNRKTKSFPALFHFNGGGKVHHLAMEAKMWYKSSEYNGNSNSNNREVIQKLKNHLVNVPSHIPDGKMKFNDLCPGYVDKEYMKYL